MSMGWSDEELCAAVEAYRQMARNQEAGIRFNRSQIYSELAARFGRTKSAFEYRMQNISAVYQELGMPWIAGLKPAKHVGSKSAARLIKIIQQEGLEADVGVAQKDGLVWEKALAAVTQLGGIASRKQVKEWILDQDPEYDTDNLSDLYMLAVNSPSRTSYGQNATPRKTDEGSPFDRLFKVGRGIFEIYDPVQHGIWEIYADASSGNRNRMSVRQVSSPVDEALATSEEEALQTGSFDPTSVADTRKRVTAAIIRRRGQPAFRKALMDAYSGVCAISGCNLPDVLEAAHVHPYKGDHTDVVSNGLLLRADIHTLFDLGLIAIESKNMLVRVAPQLASTSYAELDGAQLHTPAKKALRVSKDALDWHRSQCGWFDMIEDEVKPEPSV
jgi:Predicted restriction endonuclease